MANRQCYPADALFPLRGDVSAEAGAITVTVQGIQMVPIDQPVSPTDDLKVATYVNADGRIEWRAPNGIAVAINGVGTSPDKQIFINGVSDGATVWGINIEGVPDGG